MTVITGAVEALALRIASASVETSRVTVRWCGYVPHCTAAAGVSRDIPPAMSAAAMRGSVLTPMYSTIVPPARASADQSTVAASFPGSSCPVTNVTDVDETAVRHRDSGVRRRGNARRHAGDDLERDAGGGERLRLFAAATKHERIAALESNDALPFAARDGRAVR